jgi:S-adenosylmethionine synthetase
MRNIVVDFPKVTPVHKQHIELVERKGIGHPDSICDGIAEAVSVALSREYKRRYGRVYHHNTDQVELVGGEAHPKYGGGDFIEPIYILLSGRATANIGHEKVPTGMIAVKAAKEYLKQNFRNLDVDAEVKIDQKIGRGSADLTHVFEQKGVPKSNDTSFGVGYAPLSTTEQLVLKTEKYIYNGLGMKETGEDVKVMGVRNGDKITLTVACAMVSKYIKDLDSYISTMEELHSKLLDHACKQTGKEVEIHINTADDYKQGSVYLTMTGLSAEGGDDGSVGRGNRANGLITPYRPMSLEATSGKNPINHVGKIYNLLSKEIAEDIAEAGAEQVHVRLLSQIGRPIDQPLIASVEVVGDKVMEAKARQITDRWLEDIGQITQMCMEGKACTF